MKKKILFISYALPPYLYPQSIQVGRFLKELKDRYDIHILSATENTAPDLTLYPDLLHNIPDNQILRVPYESKKFWGRVQHHVLSFFYNRPDVYKAWADQAYHACIQQFGDVKFDVIATFSFPLSLNLLGARLKDHFGCKWIAHQSDPWADNPFMHYGPLLWNINNRLEQKCFDRADRLIFTNAEACEFFQKKYPQRSADISYIDHSFDPAVFPSELPEAGDKKIIRYVGGFYGNRTARALLDALARLPAEAKDKLHFEIVGANLKTRMMVQKSKLPESLISCTGRVNYAGSLSLMRRSDVLLVIDAPIDHNNIFFPSKLADYIGAERPIIGISSPGPTDRILKSLGYACYRHDQTEDLVEAFSAIAAGGHIAAALSGHDAYLDSLNAAKLADVLDHA